MRVRLSIEDSLGSKKPFLYMTVKSRACRLRSYTKAFIDTGSPHGLILNMLEAKRMQFSFRGREAEITRLGGHKIRLFSAGNTTLFFYTDLLSERPAIAQGTVGEIGWAAVLG